MLTSPSRCRRPSLGVLLINKMYTIGATLSVLTKSQLLRAVFGSQAFLQWWLEQQHLRRNPPKPVVTSDTLPDLSAALLKKEHEFSVKGAAANAALRELQFIHVEYLPPRGRSSRIFAYSATCCFDQGNRGAKAPSAAAGRGSASAYS